MSLPPIPNTVDAIVTVTEVLSDRTARVALPNGRDVFGYFPARREHPPLQAGERYEARLLVADFSRAELRSKASSEG